MAIVDVVKYNGSSEVFAWKYPSEELSTWSKLIVNESQEAILFKGGEAFDVFGSGTYTLETKNIPLLNSVVKLPFGGKTPFSAEVWYVNKLYKLDIKWGTASPIQIQDSKYGIFVPVRSNGMFGIQITDSKKFLTKLVGTVSVFNEQNMVRYFRGLFVTKVKDSISTYVVNNGVSLLEINAYLDAISAFIKERIEPEMKEYGIELVSFYVNDISVPEDDQAVEKLKGALAKKAEMDIIGYNYQQERSFDTMEAAAQNEGAGTSAFVGAGMGLGMGVGVGNAMADFTSQLKFTNADQNTKKCPACGTIMPGGAKFCYECGNQLSKKCVNCGMIVSGISKFCPECGSELE